MTITDQAKIVYAAGPSSAPSEPDKKQIIALFKLIDALLSSAINGLLVGNAVVYATRSALYADLAHPANRLGVVYNDPTADYNGIYIKSGSSGSGSWSITNLALPSTFAADLAAAIADIEALQTGKLDNSIASGRVFGRWSAGTGSAQPLEVTGGLETGTNSLRIADEGVTTAKLDDEAVTNAKLALMPQATFKGRVDGAGTGPVTDVTVAQAKTTLSIQNIDNTSDMDKPVSTAQAAALEAEAEARAAADLEEVTARSALIKDVSGAEDFTALISLIRQVGLSIDASGIHLGPLHIGGDNGGGTSFLTELAQRVLSLTPDELRLGALRLGGNVDGNMGIINELRQMAVNAGPDGLDLGALRIAGSADGGIELRTRLGQVAFVIDQAGFGIGNGVFRVTAEAQGESEILGIDLANDAARYNAPPAAYPFPAGSIVRAGRRLEIVADPLQSDGQIRTPPNIIVADGQAEYTPIAFQALPGIAVTGGRWWAAWSRNASIDTGGEELGNFVVVAFSDDEGATWTEAFYAVPTDQFGSVANDPQLWVDPDGKLWLFLCQQGPFSHAEQMTTWACIIKNPTAANRRFFITKSRFIADGTPTAPFDIDGEPHIVINYWRRNPGRPERAGKIIHRLHWREFAVSRVGKVPDVPNAITTFDECSVVQCPDGTFFSVFRTTEGMYFSRGSDLATWDEPAPFTALGATAVSRPLARVTTSGRLALVFNNSTSRTNLTIALSDDGGLTWPHVYLFDSRANVAYPALAEDGSGHFLIVYDRERTSLAQITIAKIAEAGIVSGSASVQNIVVSEKP